MEGMIGPLYLALARRLNGCHQRPETGRRFIGVCLPAARAGNSRRGGQARPLCPALRDVRTAQPRLRRVRRCPFPRRARRLHLELEIVRREFGVAGVDGHAHGIGAQGSLGRHVEIEGIEQFHPSVDPELGTIVERPRPGAKNMARGHPREPAGAITPRCAGPAPRPTPSRRERRAGRLAP